MSKGLVVSQKERDALEAVLDRAYKDAEDYLLGPHAKLDYCDEYAECLRRNAEDFRQVGYLLAKLAMPRAHFEELAKRLEDVAKEEEASHA